MMTLHTTYFILFKRLPCNYYVLTYLIAFILQCQMTSSSSSMPQSTSLGIFMVRSPESIVAPNGDEVLFECELNLVPERLEWRFRHITAASSKTEFFYLHKEDGYNITHEDGMSKLRIYVSPGTLGDYQCVAWFGTAAIASVTARLTLASISLANQTENGSSNNRNKQAQIMHWRVSPNNSVLIKCGNAESNPQPVWSFYKNNKLIPQSDLQLPSGGIILNSVTSKDSGLYSCSAVNAITGTEIQLPQKIDLSVEYMQKTAPYFLFQPANIFTARLGQTVVLQCPGVGNPPPSAIWSYPNSVIPSDRITNFNYGLQIMDIESTDRGTYVCRLDNGIAPILVHTVKLEILEKPIISKGPPATLTNEGESLEIECTAKGSPTPRIYWMINGENTSWDSLIKHNGNKLIIKSVEKRHAGIVQCFAKNDVGETSEGNLLQVNPKQIPGEIGMQPLGSFPTKSSYDHPGKQNKGRKKHKSANMVPPSRPNVTRLSDDSVMLRWYVPKNDGLPIQFFKVQYRMIGDTARKIPRENWQTTNDDIPYGKRDKNNNGIKNFTTSVTGLKPDKYYKFRIIAVYSNNDNKEGNSSGKFLLQRGSKNLLPAPGLTKVEGISETAIVLHWSFPYNKSNPVDGFYVYYRPASTAGEYLKATVVGMHTRHFKIDMLESGTAYEFKLQSFTASAASEFSSILTGKTMRPPTPPPQITPSVIPASKASEDNNSMFPVIAGAAGGGLLLLLAAVIACFCVKRRKSSQQEDEDKPQLDHIQADAQHFLPPSVIGSQHHKSPHRMNGVMPRMNITPNPLATEGDKNRNVMELRFMPTTGGSNHHQIGTTPSSPTTTGTGPGGGSGSGHGHHQLHHQSSTSISSGIPIPIPHQQQQHHSTTTHSHNHHHQQQQQQQQQHQQHHQQQQQQHHQSPYHPQTPTMLQKQQHHQQNNNHHPHHFQGPPMTPSLEQHRRTLERSTRNLNYPGGTSSVDGVSDGIPTRIPSLRRTRRTSGSSTNNVCGSGGGGGGVVIPGSPRVQRSPMPARAAVAIKRNRLGSHTENMSSGSLNSIEV